MCSAWVIQRVCGGTSLLWSGGGWRRHNYFGRDSASPRWPERWASTAPVGQPSGRRTLGQIMERLTAISAQPELWCLPGR